MKRTVFLCMILGLVIAASVGAQALQATVKEVSGKVEVKAGNADWQAVAANMVIAQGSTLSTGFNSRLVLMIGQTQLIVKPLTRLLLEELVKRESTNVAGLALKVGKVNASVKSAAGERTEFTLKGPASTAAVRGTEFDYDGYALQVTEGIVQFFNLLSQQRAVGAGDTSETDGYNYPSSSETGKILDSNVGSPTGGASTGGGGNLTPVLTGAFVVTIQ
jgi:hypothetical protein